MNTQLVYKITTLDCKSAMSLSHRWDAALTVQYSTTDWAVSHQLSEEFAAPLFAFSSLADASHFFHLHKRRNAQWIIWQAEARNVRKKTVVHKVNRRFSLGSVLSFWLGFSRANTKRGMRTFFVCDAIKLVRAVEPEPETVIPS